MVQLFVNPFDAGHAGIARPRTYIMFYNKNRLEYKHDVGELYRQISFEIQKSVVTQPPDYLVSSPTGRAVDLMSLARKRGVPFAQVSWLEISSSVLIFFTDPLCQQFLLKY